MKLNQLRLSKAANHDFQESHNTEVHHIALDQKSHEVTQASLLLCALLYTKEEVEEHIQKDRKDVFHM